MVHGLQGRAGVAQDIQDKRNVYEQQAAMRMNARMDAVVDSDTEPGAPNLRTILAATYERLERTAARNRLTLQAIEGSPELNSGEKVARETNWASMPAFQLAHMLNELACLVADQAAEIERKL